MKRKLQKLLLPILASTLFTGVAVGQVNYSEGFESFEEYDYPGTGYDFWASEESACTGTTSLAINLYFDPFWGGLDQAETVFNMGTSNGGIITLTYDYQILTYGGLNPVENSDDWGMFQLSYSNAEDGVFTPLETINTTNHVVSANCATRTITFSPPAGSEVYLKIYGELDNYDNDFYIFFDNINAVQAAPVACSGTPAESATLASSAEACTTQPVTLTLANSYSGTGLEYQWQSSLNGTDFSNVATGGNSSYYVTVQSETTWYRAVVTCTNSTEFVNTTPVMVATTGAPCYCEIDFYEDVEPITYVSFAGIDNESSAVVNDTPGVQDFTELPPAEVLLGETYTIAVEGNSAGNFENYYMLYIDFDHNGAFDDAGEAFEIGMISNSTGIDGAQATAEIQIPATAMTGITYMRVLKLYFDYSSDPCSSDDGIGYGQAEDYRINIWSTDQLDYVNLQWPPTLEVDFGTTGTVYAQAWEDGVTPGPGPGAGVMAWIGIGEENTDPANWTTWIPATYNTAVTGNNDEFMADIGAGLEPGTYYYASRFQLNGGPYNYGGYTASGGGIWDGVTNISGVLTVTCDTEAPVATATQAVCDGETLAVLEADGDTIIWYAAETGGEPLGEDSELIDGMTYYAAVLPNGGCESETRTAVTVQLTVLPELQVSVTHPECNETAGAIVVTAPVGEDYLYSIDGSGFQVSPIFSNLAPGEYTVYLAGDGCITEAEIEVNNPPANPSQPEVTVVQPTCAGNDGSITVVSPNGTGYMYSMNGADFQASNVFSGIEAGVYMIYAQNASGCNSEPFTVQLELATLEAPVADAAQTVCNNSEVEELMAEGTNVMWYADATGGTPLDIETILVDGATYYAESTDGVCVSERTEVTVTFNIVPAPTGDAVQSFDEDELPLSFDDIVINAEGELEWYASEEDALNSDDDLDNDYEITESQTLYVTQEIDGCESAPFAVTIEIVPLGVQGFDSGAFAFYPNPVSNTLNLEYKDAIEKAEVYSLLGQQVLVKEGSNNVIQLDMAQLSAGTYLVKVTAAGQMNTIKVVKQ